MPPNCPYGRPRTYPFPAHSPALPRNSGQVYRIPRILSTAAPTSEPAAPVKWSRIVDDRLPAPRTFASGLGIRGRDDEDEEGDEGR